MDSEDQVLDLLLKKLQDSSYSSLSPDELVCLTTSFLPIHTAPYRSKAYLVLSTFCDVTRKSLPQNQNPDLVSQSLANVLAPLVVSRLGDVDENSVMAGISFLTALFPVDQDAATSLFLRDGIVDSVADSVDLFSSREFALEVAHLLGQASGHKSCRAAISPQSLQWLEVKSRQTVDTILRAAAGIALIKLVRGRASDGSNAIGSEGQADSNKDEELAKLMKGIVITGDDQSPLTEAVEGLAYLSVDSSLKEDLSCDAVFLTRLFSLVPRQRGALRATAINSPLWYGIVVIISNICVYRPRLNEEGVQIERLKRMAKAGKRFGPETPDSGLDDDDHCRGRARRLVAAGVLSVLTAVVHAADSSGIRSTVAKALLSIVEDKENRGKVLQSGGAKTLALIIRHFMSHSHSDPTRPTTTSVLAEEQLPAIQALAKLAITSSPIQVFGPNEGTMYDTIRPFALLLLHPSSTLLQQFEAMMALTNLSSHSPELATRIVKMDGLTDKVELFLLEDHILVRRAAMELMCNLIAGCDEMFERYSRSDRATESKVQVLLALSDVHDLQTRLAASGALATLTAAPTACHVMFDLQLKRHRVFPILTRLIDPSSLSKEAELGDEDDDDDGDGDPGLIHRGVICIRNFFLNIQEAGARKQIFSEAEKVGLTRALVKVVQDNPKNEIIARPTLEALKWLKDAVD